MGVRPHNEATSPDWSNPHTINRWPGHHGIEKADKVATRVGYSKTRDEVKNWGFESVFGDDQTTVREQFKLTLDPEYQDDRGSTWEEARQWYFDYLTCLHREIEKFFDTSIPRWRSMRVEYSFSTPTTWKNPAMIAGIEKLIKSAGFTDTAQQTVRMALTEAEAAAIDASTTKYREGDIFLICDSGGGTTDVNLLRVKSMGQKIELEPLDHVEGVPIGSCLIDYQMAQHIVERLELIQEHLEGDLYYLAEDMLVNKFQTIKHSFPKPVVDQVHLEVKGLAGSQTYPEAGIKNSRMAIDRSTITEIFDAQVSQIFELIDERFLALEAEFPQEQISYIILSGGLGSSPYLYEKIKKRYEINFGFRSKNSASVRIMKVLEPYLAVVRGLVRERTQQLGVKGGAGQEVFGTRQLAAVQYRLTANDMKPEKGQGWKVVKKTKCWKADFFFVVKLGPADIKFQIVGMNGMLSSDHDSLDVEYLEGPEATALARPPDPPPMEKADQRKSGIKSTLWRKAGRWPA
ncbi:hypothetical protein B0A54_04027 [Friedmanniomyces endolithicus]|uniref:Actin-like ATPase domain-containing protein n=1 Tax=Friedmanniomyces endolithicus TaxID=329885 RepID=A0A4U0V9C8_9PEZI|nr:hypothetical protein B0A54_04027 [Friedmanniomyces endolithicus]